MNNKNTVSPTKKLTLTAQIQARCDTCLLKIANYCKDWERPLSHFCKTCTPITDEKDVVYQMFLLSDEVGDVELVE